MKRLFVVVATLILTASLMLIGTPRAIARCHSFSVSSSPSSVDEGGSVKVTVSRDAAFGPSQVDVETVNESAVAGQDYTGIPKQTVNFTEGAAQTTSKEFTVPVANDTTNEPAERFRVHLSNPGGCEPTPLTVGPDATVTIAASDAPAQAPGQAPPAPAARTSPSPSPSPSPSATPSPSLSPVDSSSPSPTATAIAVSQVDEESGRSVWPIVGIVALVVAAGAGGWLYWMRRKAA